MNGIEKLKEYFEYISRDIDRLQEVTNCLIDEINESNSKLPEFAKIIGLSKSEKRYLENIIKSISDKVDYLCSVYDYFHIHERRFYDKLDDIEEGR